MPTRIALTTHASTDASLRDLSTTLQLPIVEPSCTDFDYLLVLDADQLQLKKINSAYTPIAVDFLSGKNHHRKQYSQGRQEIARAMGPGKPLSILDATAGLARDSFVLASLGHQVHMLERSPILCALIQDGLTRARGKEAACGQLQLTCINAIDYLYKLSQSKFPQIIYLDPMFPDRKKSALVKKEMIVCRDLVGDDLDAPTLLNLALTRALKRVVVKRPRLAPTLTEKKPDAQIIGKSVRFDIYLTHAL